MLQKMGAGVEATSCCYAPDMVHFHPAVIGVRYSPPKAVEIQLLAFNSRNACRCPLLGVPRSLFFVVDHFSPAASGSRSGSHRWTRVSHISLQTGVGPEGARRMHTFLCPRELPRVPIETQLSAAFGSCVQASAAIAPHVTYAAAIVWSMHAAHKIFPTLRPCCCGTRCAKRLPWPSGETGHSEESQYELNPGLFT